MTRYSEHFHECETNDDADLSRVLYNMTQLEFVLHTELEFDNDASISVEVDTPIKYCPYCGEELREEA